MTTIHYRLVAVALGVSVGGCHGGPPPRPIEVPPTPEIAQIADQASKDATVRSTILPGEQPVPVPPNAVTIQPKRGNVTLNFPGADVRVVAKAVLGDLLRLQYAVAEGVNGQVTLVTPGPVAKSALLDLFETALKNANLALVRVAGGFEIQSTSAARGNGPIAADTAGYGTEVIVLKFVNAEEMRKLLESVLPGVVTAVDTGRNTVTIVGTTGQRSSAHDLLGQFDVDWLRSMSFALFVPQRTDARLIVPELNKLINAPDAPMRGLVRLISMERLNGILAITSQPRFIEDVKRWVEILDREGESSERRLFVYRVQNGRSRDLARTLNAAFGNSSGGGESGAAGNPDPFAEPDRSATQGTPSNDNSRGAGAGGNPSPASGAARDGQSQPADRSDGQAADSKGRITFDETNNAVIVFGTPREYAVVEEALRKLDLPPLQVMIEAAITEVTLTDDLRYGVQWNFTTGNSNFGYSEGSTPAPTRINPGFSYFYSGNNISAALNALEKRTNVKVISAPKLLTLNNQTAALQVGDQVPVSTGSAVSVQNADAPIVNSIEYRNTGVILKVTPRVNAGGLVLLDVSQEVSAVSTTAGTDTSSQASSPTISTRRIATTIAVQDGQVIALGGLFRDTRTYGKNGIPIISRVPVLGALFGTHENLQNRTELIVLLKPHVIRSADDGRAVTEELLTKLRTLRPYLDYGRIP